MRDKSVRNGIIFVLYPVENVKNDYGLHFFVSKICVYDKKAVTLHTFPLVEIYIEH